MLRTNEVSVIKTVLILFFSIFIVSSCTTLNSSVYIDNLGCSTSIVDNAIDIISKDRDGNRNIKEVRNEIGTETIVNLLKYDKREFEELNLRQGSIVYSFMFQNFNNSCFLRLYKKTMDGSIREINNITFIDSRKLKLCRCGGMKVNVPIL